MKDWQKIEAVLFGSGKYLTEEQISTLSGVQKKSLKNALNELKKHYDQIESSLNVFNESDAWKLNVREEYASIVRNVISEAEMARPIMETLAIIAYKSPVLQSEVIDIRGAGAYEHITLLEEKGFITKDKFGRTFKLRVAQKFYDYFDIEGDKKLRALFKDIKKPEKLGTLDTYDSDKKEIKEESIEFSENLLERMKKVELNPSDHEEKKKFLEDFDKKFTKTKTDIDETDSEMNEFRRVEQPSVTTENSDNNSEEVSLDEENSREETINTDKNFEAKENNDDEDTETILKKFNEEVNKLDSQNVEVKEELKEDVQDEHEVQEEISEEVKEDTISKKQKPKKSKKLL